MASTFVTSIGLLFNQRLIIWRWTHMACWIEGRYFDWYPNVLCVFSLFCYPGIMSRCQFSDTWWRHQMETSSALLAICAGNSPFTGEFPQRPVTRSFGVFFGLRLNERFSKQSCGWRFEAPSRPIWRHSNEHIGGWATRRWGAVTCLHSRIPREYP